MATGNNQRPSTWHADLDNRINQNGTRAITGTIANEVFSNLAKSIHFYFPLADTAERNNLATDDKYEGAIVFVASDERMYYLESDLSTWNKILTQSDVQSLIDTATAGFASRLFDPVQDLAALKDIDTTDSNDWPDKGMILVEDLGLYRLDRQSVSTADDNRIIQPTSGVGRWLKMSPKIDDHNNTLNKQGGKTGEYYHLTGADYNDIVNGFYKREYQIKTVTSDYIITLQDCTILVDASGGPVEIAMVDVIAGDGYWFNIKKIDASANTVTIIPFESSGGMSQSFSVSDPDFINVEFEPELQLTTKGEVVNLQSDGLDWYLIA